jgi:hypothetical protein
MLLKADEARIVEELREKTRGKRNGADHRSIPVVRRRSRYLKFLP